MRKPIIIPILLVLIFAVSCGRSTKEVAQNNSGSQAIPGPPVIIYKTSIDYKNNVAVQLNTEKTEIISFPAPSDIRAKDSKNLPVQLEGGYLLDRTGIYANSAFLEYTFNDYAELSSTPSKDELWMKIIDKDPIEVMYECRMRNDEQLVEKLNELVRNNNFDVCEKLK